MPDEPRRIILEKSKTVKRRYQRSNQRFQFSASQIARLDREEEREKKAKQLREKEKKRIANKKRKAEQEARVREERKRRGISDPNAPRVPSSQPLLSMFLGATKPQSPVAPEPEPTKSETNSYKESNVDCDSAGGDTEPDSDALDDLDQELENDISELENASVLPAPGCPVIGVETKPSFEEDEFSDCSAFDDEDIMKEAETAAVTRTTDGKPRVLSTPNESSFVQSPSSHRPPVPTFESSFGESFQFDPADFLEAEAAILTQTNLDRMKVQSPPEEAPVVQPLPNRSLMSSFGDSFRDETADWMEEAFAHGNGDPFGELNNIPP